MINKVKGLFFFSLSISCFFYSYYWYAYHTPMELSDLIRQYSFFTNQTIFLLSIYMMGVALYYLGWKSSGKVLFNSLVKSGITSYVFAISLGYYIGVARFYTTAWESMYVGQIQSVFMHFIAPVVVGFTYHITPFIGQIDATGMVSLALYPLFYLYYAAMYGKYTGDYIYPVLNPNVMGSGIQIPIIIILAFIGFWLIALSVGGEHNTCCNDQSEFNINNRLIFVSPDTQF